MSDANYDKPELRERIKNRIKASSKGAAPGQWSAIKSNILAKEYKEAGGGYKSGKNKAQKALQKWNGEKWTTSDGGNSIRTTKSGKRIVKKYLPEKAWQNLDKKEVKALNQSKAKADKKGEQFSKAPKKLSKKVSKFWK